MWICICDYITATTPGKSGSWSDCNEGVPSQSPKLQRYWTLSIKLFCVMSKIPVRGVLTPPCRDAIDVFCSPSYLGHFTFFQFSSDSDILVSKCELQSRYYVRFRTNTLWKDMHTLILLRSYRINNHIYQPLCSGQDVTQGQFFSEV